MVNQIHIFRVLVPSMFKPLALTIFCVTCVMGQGAYALGPKLPGAPTRDAREGDSEELLRRKADLRAALQAQKSAASADGQAGSDSVPPGRQLSDQDRANLRQQIRQQRP
jgi:hypothetical protein